eukprot:Amastigsp_a174578_1363.p2 type:complete len:167 gc:universal Amastigsp_a174578_1363:187-687(+)
MSEPAIERRPKMSGVTAGDGCGCSGAPTSVSVQSRLRRAMKGSRLCDAATEFRMKSKDLLGTAAISSALVDTTTSLAPRRSPSARFDADDVNSTTSAPIATASLTAMWPRPPRPTMPTRMPGPTFQWRSGEYIVMPAQSSGATAASLDSSCLIFITNSSVTTICFE